eukprot:SAG11_NODE_35657_length_265_cov_1.253012_1_plen_44_part_01
MAGVKVVDKEPEPKSDNKRQHDKATQFLAAALCIRRVLLLLSRN